MTSEGRPSAMNLPASAGSTDPCDQIAHLEDEIELLSDSARQCRKIALLAKAAMAIGMALLLEVLIGQFAQQAIVFVIGVAAVLGGLVLLGSNKTTLDELNAEIAEHEALRARMIDQLELQTVGNT